MKIERKDKPWIKTHINVKNSDKYKCSKACPCIRVYLPTGYPKTSKHNVVKCWYDSDGESYELLENFERTKLCLGDFGMEGKSEN